jgi:hypothetical protein
LYGFWPALRAWNCKGIKLLLALTRSVFNTLNAVGYTLKRYEKDCHVRRHSSPSAQNFASIGVCLSGLTKQGLMSVVEMFSTYDGEKCALRHCKNAVDIIQSVSQSHTKAVARAHYPIRHASTRTPKTKQSICKTKTISQRSSISHARPIAKHRLRVSSSSKNSRLNNKQLLDIRARTAFAHAVPRGVAKTSGDGPHNGYGGFGGS